MKHTPTQRIEAVEYDSRSAHIDEAYEMVVSSKFALSLAKEIDALASSDLNAQRIRMIESAEWITSPDDGVLSKGQWRLHIRKPEGGQTTVYGKTLIELLDNTIANAQPVVTMLREGRV